MRVRIPEATIRRLPIYLRVLTELADDKVDVVSSADLSSKTGFTSEQIRKDLAYFGAFGVRGVGYSTAHLRQCLRQILGLDKEVRVVIVGAGHLGTALARYNITRHKDVKVVAILDSDPEKIGTEIEGVKVSPVSEMKKVVAETGAKMAVIAVPAPEAYRVAKDLSDAGIQAILNFAPIKIDSMKGTYVQNVDLTLELESLAYYTSRPEERGKETPLEGQQ